MTTTNFLSKHEQVVQLAIVLDEIEPDWVRKLTDMCGPDLHELHVSSPFWCVLKAIYDDYTIGSREVESALRDRGESPTAYDDAIACDEEQDVEMRAIWLEAVNARRG